MCKCVRGFGYLICVSDFMINWLWRRTTVVFSLLLHGCIIDILLIHIFAYFLYFKMLHVANFVPH